MSDCGSCGASGAAYRFHGDGSLRCLRCFIAEPRLLRRALATSLVVGSVLTFINQGDVLLYRGLSPAVVAKVLLTCLVPFCVTLWGALGYARRD